MTGYGRAQGEVGGKPVTLEIKALNSRFLDLHFKVFLNLGERELTLRTQIGAQARRGKIDFILSEKSAAGRESATPGLEKIKRAVTALRVLAHDMNVSDDTLFRTALMQPELQESGEPLLGNSDWESLQSLTLSGLKALEESRKREGLGLEKDLQQRVARILEHWATVKKMEQSRIPRKKEKLREQLEEAVGEKGFDPGRLEQEMIYYLEKWDISEEMQRLESHGLHFLETLGTPDPEKGKALSFIVQEMLREINTLGSKANDSKILGSVISMKEEVEKIREQVNNVL